MDEPQLRRLGDAVEAARLRRGQAKEAAARAIGVSSITLKRVEDGLAVRPDSLARVLNYFGLPFPGEGDAGLGVTPANLEAVRAVIETADLPEDTRRALLERLDRDTRPTPPPASPVKPRATGTGGQ